MAFKEIDIGISQDAEVMRDAVKEFAMRVLRPIGIELDRVSDPSDVIAEDSVLWEAIRAFREMGLHRIDLPGEVGGFDDVEPIARILINEELAYADAGLAIGLQVSCMPFMIASMSPHREVRDLARAYCEDKEGSFVGCWAMIEPDHGSDWILSSQPGFDDPRLVPTVRAVKKGSEYIITGQKAAWVSNGSIATHACVHLNLDPSFGMRGDGIAVVPLDLPGVSRGKPLNKIGQRSLNQGEVFFDEVVLPSKYMVVSDPGAGTRVKDSIVIWANSLMGQVFTGVAQAAFDQAVDYAKNRIQGGKRIFEHQSVRLRLFKMFTSVESIRAFSRRTTLYNTTTVPPSAAHAVACKVLATETAFHVASEAIQILGGNGLSKEYIVEKIFRDARASMIEDGENNVLSLLGASYL